MSDSSMAYFRVGEEGLRAKLQYSAQVGETGETGGHQAGNRDQKSTCHSDLQLTEEITKTQEISDFSPRVCFLTNTSRQ